GADAVASCTAAATKGAAPAVTPAPAQPAINPQHVFLMTAILGDQEARRPMFGASAALLSLPDRPSAAKTGTSNDYRDAWTLGYTPDLAVGVWLGNADNKPMQKVAGSLGAAPVWQNTMARALQGKPVQSFVEPPGIQRIRVCADTGTLPSEACQNTREELFAANQGPLPAQFDLHQRVRVDKVTGKLATEFTPADRIETRDAMIFPSKYRAWAEAHGIPQFAADQPAYAFPPELTLYSPLNDGTVTGVVEIGGRIHLPPPLVWRVEYGVGRGPIGWGVISGPAQGDVDGIIAGWDTAKPVAKHNVDDFSLRLAAYDPANMDYPAAVSNVAYVRVIVPTATPTSTPTPSRTPTSTPTATLTPTLAATATATPAATASPSPAPTLAATPTAAPTAAPLSPTSTSTSASPSTATPTTPPPATAPPTAALALRAIITEPADRATVSGPVKIMGTADGPTFSSYVLEFVPGEQEVAVGWLPVELPKTAPVTAGQLGLWHTETLKRGTYTLRLQVTGTNGMRAVAVVRVVVGP
ncbi:MAG: hypothetical protein NT169_12450, partial [Chloroflexi bacterium]|nr:hypothetical protein [Chloroflexota bacterium]